MGYCPSYLERHIQVFLITLISAFSFGRADAKIKRPTPEKIMEYQQAVYRLHPFLGDVWCTMDGVKFMVKCSGDDDEQNRFYNGWTCDHYIGAVLVFCPDGTIPICYYNVPGTIHDSLTATIGKIYDKLKVVYERAGARCTVDSAFARKDYPFLIKSRKISMDMTIDEMKISRYNVYAIFVRMGNESIPGIIS